MRSQIGHGVKLVALPILVLMLVLGAGCGGDSGGDPDPAPDCEISGVNTSLQNSWLSGEAVDIRWTGNGVPGTVLIELLKGGDVVATIAAGADNIGFFPWVATTTGQANGADFGIRVSGTGESTCSGEVHDLTILDVENCNFVFAPISAAKDTIFAGQETEIIWTGDHTSGMVDLELWTTGIGGQLGNLIGLIAFDVPDVGSYVWTADSFNNAAVANYRYVIRDVMVDGCEAMSDPFTIFDDNLCDITVIGPSDGQVFAIGDILTFDFIQTNGFGVVDLRLYAGGMQVPNGDFGKNISVLDSFTWTVNDFGFTQAFEVYNVRAFDTTDTYCIGESPRFTITPP